MYHPLTKLKSVRGDVVNKLGIERAMAFIVEYHNSHQTGVIIHETHAGRVKVFSADDTIHVDWDDA